MKLKLLPLLALLSGCATGPTVSVPVPPKWAPPQAAKTVFSAQEVRLAIAVLRPEARVSTTDAVFTIVDHDWLVAMVRWSEAFLRATNHGFTPESFDCDKFAKAFTLGCEWAAGDAGVKAQPLVARIGVVQSRAFGGVAGNGGGHALVGFLSTRGYYVLEPQPGGPVFLRLVPINDYPNAIFDVKIGG